MLSPDPYPSSPGQHKSVQCSSDVNTKQSHYSLAIKALKGINFDDKELG